MEPEIEPEPRKPTSTEQNPVHVDMERVYAPFIRRDVYGLFGKGDLPWMEKVLMALALVTLFPLRLCVGGSMLVFYYIVCRVCTLFQEPNKEKAGQEDYAHMQGWRRKVIVNLGKFLSRIFLFVIGFYRIREINLEPQNEGKQIHEARGRPGAIISNHVSYIDIVYHMSSSFPSFVAKREVAELPVVGLISKCLGCIYVEREGRFGKGVSGVVSKRIKEAQQYNDVPPLMLFPEGTTTNGDFLLPFRTGAFLPKAPVLPVILRYPYERFSLAYESISWGCHAVCLLCQFVNHMEVICLPVYYPSEEEMNDPRLYANNVRSLMAATGKLTLSEIGLVEKRAYHAACKGLLKFS